MGKFFCAAESEDAAAFWDAVASKMEEEPYTYTDVGYGVYVT